MAVCRKDKRGEGEKRVGRDPKVMLKPAIKDSRQKVLFELPMISNYHPTGTNWMVHCITPFWAAGKDSTNSFP